MSDLRKAAEQALEALQEINKLSIGKNAICLPAEIDDAMDALRAVLAKCNYPDCVDNGPDGKCTRWLLAECEKSEDYKPQRKPLTDEEIGAAANSVRWSQQYHVDFTRAIERAHGIGGEYERLP